MTTTTKPTIVFVHGAWHGPHHLEPFAEKLREAGYECVLPKLPSVGGDPPVSTFDPDVEAVREAVLQIVDQGGQCVVVLHSYAGVPGSEAMKGLGKPERSRNGEKGGVIAVLYLTAWLLHEGQSLLGLNKGIPPPVWDVQGDEFYPINPVDLFYNDVPEELGKEMCSSLKAQSLGSMKSPLTYAAWRHIPSTYLICEEDHAIKLPMQEAMVASTNGVIAVERCNASHSPFLSQPEAVIKVIKKLAGG